MKVFNMVACKCRQCDKIYDEAKSLAHYKGFCSLDCQHQMAKSLGYKKKRRYDSNNSEYKVLKPAGQIGSVYVDQPPQHKHEPIDILEPGVSFCTQCHTQKAEVAEFNAHDTDFYAQCIYLCENCLKAALNLIQKDKTNET